MYYAKAKSIFLQMFPTKSLPKICSLVFYMNFEQLWKLEELWRKIFLVILLLSYTHRVEGYGTPSSDFKLDRERDLSRTTRSSSHLALQLEPQWKNIFLKQPGAAGSMAKTEKLHFPLIEANECEFQGPDVELVEGM